jgi:hypothetical protein
MVIGALEQIATAVERERRDAKKYGGARLRSLNDETESTLREGIMKWFDEVERNKKAIETQKMDLMKEAASNNTQAADDAASQATLRPGQTRQKHAQHPGMPSALDQIAALKAKTAQAL